MFPLIIRQIYDISFWIAHWYELLSILVWFIQSRQHGITILAYHPGHYLGMDVHDSSTVSYDRTLKPGVVSCDLNYRLLCLPTSIIVEIKYVIHIASILCYVWEQEYFYESLSNLWEVLFYMLLKYQKSLQATFFVSIQHGLLWCVYFSVFVIFPD